jgi:hypothetical protein
VIKKTKNVCFKPSNFKEASALMFAFAPQQTEARYPDFLFLSLFTLYVGGNILPVLSAKELGRSTKGH